MPPPPFDLPVEPGVERPRCDDPAYQEFLTVAHMLQPNAFETSVKRFSPATPAGLMPQRISYQIIEGEVNRQDVDCDGYKVYIDFDDTDTTANTDIKFRVNVGAVTTFYSISLFRGLLKRFPSTAEFQFFKAVRTIRGKNFVDVVFRIVDGGRAVYFGDLSELYP
ncbi:hypothetical protein [Taibaiella koreensis]|uniref:hypothetical protein n=1 Tax=Taibaiella koreensis TaxID=1268548 RepID=UPI000E59C390|nr:hypothetical protein [Taibaiella koreensis]